MILKMQEIHAKSNSQTASFPVDTRRRFNVCKTSIRRLGRTGLVEEVKDLNNSFKKLETDVAVIKKTSIINSLSKVKKLKA